MHLFDRYKHLLVDCVLLFFVSCIPVLWFPKDYMVTGHDAGYPINITQAYLNRFFTWNSADTFGQDTSMNMGTLPIHSVEAGFRAMGLSLYDAQKFSFIFWFFGILLSMYVFAKTITTSVSSRYFPLVASLVYGVNFYLLELWKYGAATTFTAYIALPLVMSYVLRLYNERANVLRSSLGIAFVLFIFNGGAGFSIPLFGGLIVSVGCAVCYFGYLATGKHFVEFLRRTLGVIILVSLFSFILNAYWIFPFANYVFSNFSSDVALHGGTAGILSWADSVSKNTSILNLFRLQGFPDWYDIVPPSFATSIVSHPLFIFISLLFAPLAYASIFCAKQLTDKKLVVYFMLLSLLGILFSAGTHPPTGKLFAQFMIHIPGFSIFRSAQYKFIPALYFSFAFLVAYTLSYFFDYLSKHPLDKRKLVRPMFVALLGFGMFFIYHFPYFGHELFVWNKPLTTLLKIPNYVISFDHWSSSHLPAEERFLVMPRLNDMWRSEVYTWGYSSLYSLFNLITLKPFVENTNVENIAQLAYTNRLYSQILQQGPLVDDIATLLQTSRALLRNDSYFNLPWNRSDRPDMYAQIFDTASSTPRIWSEGKWSMYKLPARQNGKIYAVQSLITLIGTQQNVIAPLLFEGGQFVQTESDKSRVGDFPTVGTIQTAHCVSCIFDDQLSGPEVVPPRILPGSFLYFIKSMREKSLDHEGLDTDTLLVNRLGLSLTRAEEAAALIDLKRDTSIILSTIERLAGYWTYIDSLFGRYDRDHLNFAVVKQIEIYAASEKGLLTHSIGTSKERVVQAELSSVIQRLDRLLSTIASYREYWSNRKEYSVSSRMDARYVSVDSSMVPSGDGQTPFLPSSISVGDASIPVRPVEESEKISFGSVDMNNNTSLILHYPPLINIYEHTQTRAVTTPKGIVSCMIGDIKQYDWQKNYTISVTINDLVPNETSLYLKRIKNDHNVTDSTVGHLVSPDVTFGLRTDVRLPQTFSFSGESADVGAMVYYCIPGPWSAELAPTNLMITPRLDMDLYLTKVPSLASVAAPIQKINYTRIDQTKYIVDTSHMTFPAVLIFNENFNAKWKIYTKSKDKSGRMHEWTSTWFRSPLSDINHFVVNGYANAWYFKQRPSEDIIIEFYPQKLFYQGLLVSLLGMVVLIGLFIHIRRRRV